MEKAYETTVNRKKRSMEIIENLLKDNTGKLSVVEISQITGIKASLIYAYVKELIQQGRISKDAIYDKRRRTLNISEQSQDPDIEKERMSKIKEYIIQMVIFNIDMSPDLIQEYINYAKQRIINKEITIKEMNLLVKAMKMSTEFLSLENIRYVLTYYNSKGKAGIAINILDEFIDLSDDSQKPILKRVKLEIQRKSLEKDSRKRITNSQKNSGNLER